MSMQGSLGLSRQLNFGRITAENGKANQESIAAQDQNQLSADSHFDMEGDAPDAGKHGNHLVDFFVVCSTMGGDTSGAQTERRAVPGR